MVEVELSTEPSAAPYRAVPSAAVVVTAAIAARERARDFTSMAAFLAFGSFALVLAYGFRLRLLFLSGLACLTLFLGSAIALAAGLDWLGCFGAPRGRGALQCSATGPGCTDADALDPATPLLYYQAIGSCGPLAADEGAY